jgi:hypothetical protein
MRSKQNDTKKKLLGSIAAYFSLYTIPFTVANLFLSCSMKDVDASDIDVATKETHKKTQGTDSEAEVWIYGFSYILSFLPSKFRNSRIVRVNTIILRPMVIQSLHGILTSQLLSMAR